MATMTKRLLHLRPTFHSHARPYPYTLHHFSSSSSDRDDLPQSEQPKTQSSVSSSLDAVRASLRDSTPPPGHREPYRGPFSFSSGPSRPSRGVSRDEITSRLAEFRTRSAPPAPGSTDSSGQYVSILEIYEKNLKSNSENPNASPGLGAGGRQAADYIRESLSMHQSTEAVSPGRGLSKTLSFSRYLENFKNKTDPNGNIDGGIGNFFSNDTKRKEGGGGGSKKPLFGNAYERSIFGEKLKTMRPEKRKGKWFSLQELSDRLAKVREADAKERDKSTGYPFSEVQQSIKTMTQGANQQKRDKARSYQLMSLLGSGGEVSAPPKDDLVEKYFHPDNMSSAEKLKLELQKVKDEFKMSESDCGSARVQVAQLTTKIKHLSTLLHKKDKHSRKGLHEMVQRRKKLLKYLRRTDWDSYCLVLSKLGLRDNPDMKA